MNPHIFSFTVMIANVLVAASSCYVYVWTRHMKIRHPMTVMFARLAVPSVLQCVAVCCSMLQWLRELEHIYMFLHTCTCTYRVAGLKWRRVYTYIIMYIYLCIYIYVYLHMCVYIYVCVQNYCTGISAAGLSTASHGARDSHANV